jgi:hypothetical protein
VAGAAGGDRCPWSGLRGWRATAALVAAVCEGGCSVRGPPESGDGGRLRRGLAAAVAGHVGGAVFVVRDRGPGRALGLVGAGEGGDWGRGVG